MLINAAHAEEVRVALCENNHLYDFDLENRTREQKKSNIYKGHITRVEPSLEAVFVEYGSDRQGFLPLREIAPEYLRGDPKKLGLKELLKENDELIIQVEKEERGNKGAALSSFISLAGRYLVLMPNNPSGGGISRQISGQTREELKRILSKLKAPKSMSVIIRTAGLGRTQDELQHDLNQLIQAWDDICKISKQKKSPCLAYQEAGMLTRAVRDYLREDIHEVWVDHPAAYEEVYRFVQAVMPQQIHKLHRYTEHDPIFTHFRVDTQIETAYQREVKLPSGGSIVIDQTEALVSIDINSAKATKGADIESTATNTNLEAAEEIARQLRIRDMGGLIVIDFIDMTNESNQRKVEEKLKQATSRDRARIQFAGISRFGLLEMSRQRLRSSLEETTGSVCPRCHGTGMIRDIRSLSLTIMRAVEKMALKEGKGEVQAEVPLEIAAFMLNEKRETLLDVERDTGVRVTVLPNQHLETPHYEVRFKPSGFAPTSYERIKNREALEKRELGYDTAWLDEPAPQSAPVSYGNSAQQTKPSKPQGKAQPKARSGNQKHSSRSDTRQDKQNRPKQDKQQPQIDSKLKQLMALLMAPFAFLKGSSASSAAADSALGNSKQAKGKSTKQAKKQTGKAKASDKTREPNRIEASDQNKQEARSDGKPNRNRRRRSRNRSKQSADANQNQNLQATQGATESQAQPKSQQKASKGSGKQSDNPSGTQNTLPKREAGSRRSGRGERDRNKVVGAAAAQAAQASEAQAQSSAKPNESSNKRVSSEAADPNQINMNVTANGRNELKHKVIELDLGQSSQSAEQQSAELPANQASKDADSASSHLAAQAVQPAQPAAAMQSSSQDAELKAASLETAEHVLSAQGATEPAQNPSGSVSEGVSDSVSDTVSGQASSQAKQQADQPAQAADQTNQPVHSAEPQRYDSDSAEPKSVEAQSSAIEADSSSSSSFGSQSQAAGRASNDPRDVGFIEFKKLSEIQLSSHKALVQAKAQAGLGVGSGEAQIRSAERASNDPRNSLHS